MIVWLPFAVFFLAATVFRTSSFSVCIPTDSVLRSGIVLVAPFLKPANGVGDTPPLPYYLYVVSLVRVSLTIPHLTVTVIRYCLVGIAVMAFGVLYWACWRIVPKWFGYEFVPRKEKLSDGTVVTVVRLIPPCAGSGIGLTFLLFIQFSTKKLD